MQDPRYRYTQQDCGYETPCWVWRRNKSVLGYGEARVGGRRMLAHRAMYEVLVGGIPESKELDHLCRNPPCVNPAHLEPVTHRENLRRGKTAKLNVEQAREIRALKGKVHYLALAKRYGVGRTTIYTIWNDARWAEEAA